MPSEIAQDKIGTNFEGELRTACENFHDSWFCYTPNPSIQERQEFSRLLYNFVRIWLKDSRQELIGKLESTKIPLTSETNASQMYMVNRTIDQCVAIIKGVNL